jgi:hypothetical protein
VQDLGVKLGEPLFGAGQTDLEPFDLAQPSFTFGFGDAVDEVVADLGQARPLRASEGSSSLYGSSAFPVSSSRPICGTARLARSCRSASCKFTSG